MQIINYVLSVPSKQSATLFKEPWEYQVGSVCVNKHEGIASRLNWGTSSHRVRYTTLLHL